MTDDSTTGTTGITDGSTTTGVTDATTGTDGSTGVTTGNATSGGGTTGGDGGGGNGSSVPGPMSGLVFLAGLGIIRTNRKRRLAAAADE
jgi:hypothetical protein